MKRTKKGPRLPAIIVQAEQAMKEAVKEVYDEHARTGDPLPIWRDGKVVWITPKKKSRKSGRAAQSRRKGTK